MFVYKAKELIREDEELSGTKRSYKLTHPDSGMNIEVNYDTSNNRIPFPYKVFKEVNGSYTIYKEFSTKGDVKTAFEQAILFFEDSIYKELSETKPKQQTKPDVKKDPPKYKETPIVGDIVRVGKTYAIVTDVIGTKVEGRKIEKQEAMRILNAKKNAMRKTATEISTPTPLINTPKINEEESKTKKTKQTQLSKSLGANNSGTPFNDKLLSDLKKNYDMFNFGQISID
jgi:hypothetical protein